MGVFHDLKIIQMVPNRATHHICKAHKFENQLIIKINDTINNNNNNNSNAKDSNNCNDNSSIEIGKRKLHFIRLNHVLFDLNKLSKDTAFMIMFTPIFSVKLTASKNFSLNFTSK